MGSLKYQVVTCLNSLKAFDTSRHVAQQAGMADELIFSVGTITTYCHLNVAFAEWCRDRYGVKRLAEITPDMTDAFVASLRNRALSPATINTYVCAIKKLDVGLRQLGWRREKAPLLVTAHDGRRADVVADPYSVEDAERLINALVRIDPQYGQVARLERVSGLRISEAVHLQAEHITPDGSRIILDGPGIHTKGGRPRQVPILPQNQVVMVELLAQRHPDGHLFIHRQSLAAAIKRATSRLVPKLGIQVGNGTHSFRKLYANELFKYLLEEKALPLEEARSLVSQALGHNRIDVLKAYIGSRQPKRVLLP
ncbi:MAG: integrase domain-containing protein [Anaerolineales bacterium]|nr:integrase domain-containing protein [Anaerolineales bacterium]